MLKEGLITIFEPAILFLPSTKKPISLIFAKALVTLLLSVSCKVLEAIRSSILSDGEDF